MLYDRWQTVAREQARKLALVDAASGRRWTFRELDAAAAGIELSPEPVVTPTGNGLEFILTVLAAWRNKRVVLPCEGDSATSVPPLSPNTAHLKLTSGTTGASQLIAFTAKQLAADADNIVATMSLRPDQPNLGVISLAHSYGFSNLVTPLLLYGIPLVLCPSPMPEAVKAAAAGFESLALPAVPAMWRAWHDGEAIPPNVQLAISAGAPLPLELETAVFNQRGFKLHNFYGSSECGGIAYDDSREPRSDTALAGRPLQDVSLSLTDDGCLVVRSDAVGLGYIPPTGDRLGDGRFFTSDLAELRDGQVFLRGRSTDIINVAGRKLSPEMVEAVIKARPGVRACVVAGVPARDAARGDEVLAVIALADGASLEAVRGSVTGALSAWQFPKHWWVVPEINVSLRGKVSRREWRERYLESIRTR